MVSRVTGQRLGITTLWAHSDYTKTGRGRYISLPFFSVFWVRLLAHYPIAHLSSLLESDVTSSSDKSLSDKSEETKSLEPWRDMRDSKTNSTKYTPIVTT